MDMNKGPGVFFFYIKKQMSKISCKCPFNVRRLIPNSGLMRASGMATADPVLLASYIVLLAGSLLLLGREMLSASSWVSRSKSELNFGKIF
jgi:hypothetical protein